MPRDCACANRTHVIGANIDSELNVLIKKILCVSKELTALVERPLQVMLHNLNPQNITARSPLVEAEYFTAAVNWSLLSS